MPFVTTGLFRILREALVAGVYAAVPDTEAGLQPLCAAYSWRCLPLIEAAIDAGNLRVTDFVESLPAVRRIGVSELRGAGDPDRLFFNVNTPADLETAERMARGG
jgi:molybdenum cofactor guanylyltransferase